MEWGRNEMKSILFVRHNVEWRRMSKKQFMEQPVCRGPGGTVGKEHLGWLKQHYHIISSLWDEMFCVSYFEFRARIKELAESTFRGAEVARGLPELKRELASSQDAYVIPIDDDDWIAPGLFRALAEQTTDVVTWKMLGTFFAPALTVVTAPMDFETCSFAVRKSFVVKHPEVELLLFHHASFGEYFVGHKSRARFVDRLSMRNENMASVTVLKKEYSRAGMNELFKKRMIEIARGRGGKAVNRYSWAQAYLEKNAELHRQLL